MLIPNIFGSIGGTLTNLANPLKTIECYGNLTTDPPQLVTLVKNVNQRFVYNGKVFDIMYSNSLVGTIENNFSLKVNGPDVNGKSSTRTDVGLSYGIGARYGIYYNDNIKEFFGLWYVSHTENKLTLKIEVRK